MRRLRPILAGLEEAGQRRRERLMITRKLYYKRTKPRVVVLFCAVIKVETETGSGVVWHLLQKMLGNRRAKDGFS